MEEIELQPRIAQGKSEERNAEVKRTNSVIDHKNDILSQFKSVRARRKTLSKTSEICYCGNYVLSKEVFFYLHFEI